MTPFLQQAESEGFSIYFIRHGRTVCEPCVYGRTDVDICEPEEGDFPVFVKKHGLEDFRLCSSPLLRCRKTASYFQKALNGAPESEIIEDLQEISLGELDGLPFSKYNDRQQKLLRTALTRPAYVKIPGAENVSMLRRRAMKVMESLISRKENIIAVTHCGIIKAIYAHLMGISVRNNQLWLNWDLDFLAGLKLTCAVDRTTGGMKRSFAILEPAARSVRAEQKTEQK